MDITLLHDENYVVYVIWGGEWASDVFRYFYVNDTTSKSYSKQKSGSESKTVAGFEMYY